MKTRSLVTAAGILLLAACDARSLPTSAVPEAGAAASIGPAAGNQAPTARATVQKDSLWEGTPLRFSGARSTDPNGDPLTYTWDFGDGTSAVGKRLTHGYADNGTYNVTLTVNDGRGGSATVAFSLTIENVKPSPGNLTLPAVVLEGEAYVMSLNNPTDRGPADQTAGFTYQFDCGNGVWSAWSSAASHLCPGRPSGVVYVRGRVRDKDGKPSAVRRQALAIINQAPVILLAEAARTGPRSFDVSVRYTDAPGDRRSQITVDWGNGSSQTLTGVRAGATVTFSKRYRGSNTGPVQITVTVTDKDGASSSQNIVVQLQ